MVGLGPFELEPQPFARGGMGVVWTGRHRRDGARVAIKVLEPRADLDLVQALESELRAAAALDHPNVVAVWDRGTVDAAAARATGGLMAEGSPWYAMEYVGGGVLSWRQPWQWAGIRSAMLQLLAALAHAHARGVLHRDIKPANVLFATDGRTVKLADFGMGWRYLATAAGETRIGGTPQYMAPEQFAGDLALQGPWTDLYAVGCLLYALVYGRTPYRGSYQELRDGHRDGPFPALEPRLPVPPAVAEIVEGLTARACGERYQRAADVIAELLELPAGDSGSDQLVGRTDRKGRNVSASFPTLVALEHEALPLVAATLDPPPPAPAPDDWRAPARPAAAPVAVGLGLFGMRTLPVAGRTAERDLLWARLVEARRARRPALVVIRGPGGVGKTRLAEWLCEVADERGAAVALRGAFATGAARQGLADLVARHHRVPPGLGLEAAWHWLVRASSVERADPEEARRLAGLVAGDDADARSTPGDRAATLVRLVGRAAGSRAAVVWFDDLDHDPDALLLVGRLLRAPSLPALILVTVSSDPFDGRPATAAAFDALLGRPGVTLLDLGPLPPPEARELVSGMLPLDPAAAGRLRDQCGGDPLLAVQLLGHWVARGWLSPAEGGYRLAPEATVPASLAELWEQRLAVVVGPDPHRELLLRVGAALGELVDRAEWRAVALALALPEPEALVTRLVELGLGRTLPEAPHPFAFAHGLLRQVILERSTEAELRRVHLACAEVVGGSPERRGAHLLHAGETERAFPLLVESAGGLLRSGQPESATALLDLAEARCGPFDATDPRGVELHVERAQILRIGGRFPEALVRAEEAAAVPAVPPRLRIKVLRELSTLLLYTSGDPRVHPLLDEAFALATTTGQGDLLPALWIQRGRTLDYHGRLDAAAEAFATARLHLPPEPLDIEVGEMRMGAASVDHKRGRLQDALAACEEALDRFRRSHLTWHEIWAETMVGELRRGAGDLPGAEAAYRGVIARYEALGADQSAIPRLNLSAVLSSTGRFAEALAEALRAREEASGSGHGNLVAMADVFVAWAAAGTGDWKRFDAGVAAAGALVGRGLVDPDLLRAAESAGALAAAAGSPERAAGARALALAQAEALGREDDVARLRASTP